MRDIDILESWGCTSERLQEIFTSTDAESKDTKIRSQWEKLIESRVSNGIGMSCRNARHYQAVDLAWDSTPINKQNIPLQLYAQGKVDVKQCAKYLKDLECSDEFLVKDDKDEVIEIDIPRLHETAVNLVRSFITRRASAQSARFHNLYPYFKYDARGTSVTAKLKSDVLSQRVEIMTDQFGYRRFFSQQAVRDMFLYGYSLTFPTCRWTEEKHLVPTRNNADTPTSIPTSGEDTKGDKGEAKIEKEGLDFVNPHPTRQAWDRSKPLSKINDDLGPNWLLHWDIVLYGQVKTASGFFNRDAIDYSSSSATHVEKYKTFFDYYFNPCQIKFPNYTKNDVSSENDEKSNLNRYSTEDADKPVFLTEYFEKVIPKDLGICDYPYSVWVKLTIASDNTVVKGEFLPSIPAVYGGINQKDDRVLNNSMAHDIIPYQDQLSNIVSQMLLNMKAGLMKLYIFNKDVIDSETQEALKNILKNENYYANPQALFVSRTELADVGIDVKSAVEVIESSISHNISDSIRAMSELMGLAERLLVFSPQELGQPAPREISAREVQEISNTTNSIFTSISDDVDYQREGLKKLLYESLLCCSSDKVEVPTLERYPESVVEAAGFKIVEDKTTGEKDVIRRTILGSVQDLRHDVLFTSRDGAERFSNTQAAQTLTQLIAQVVQLPPVMEKMGDAKLFEMVNEVFRLTGSDLNLESDEDITPDLNQQLQEAIAALTQRLATVEAAAGIPSPEGQGGAPAGGAPPAAPPAGSPA